jgi:hypothetical protein
MSTEHAQTVKQLAGVWRLVSSEFKSSSGNIVYPLGEDARGVAIFTESGYMSAQLMRHNRPAFASGDQASGTPQEIQAALQGYVAYHGPCEVDVQHKTLTTQVEGSMFPNWVGGQQVRYYELSDKQLTLKTTPIAFGEEEFTGVLTWERE